MVQLQVHSDPLLAGHSSISQFWFEKAAWLQFSILGISVWSLIALISILGSNTVKFLSTHQQFVQTPGERSERLLLHYLEKRGSSNSSPETKLITLLSHTTKLKVNAEMSHFSSLTQLSPPVYITRLPLSNVKIVILYSYNKVIICLFFFPDCHPMSCTLFFNAIKFKIHIWLVPGNLSGKV